MCVYCNENNKTKEITFKSEVGIELSLCVSCINWEFDDLNKGYCEECKTFHNKSEMTYEEMEGQHLCNDCYYEFCKINGYKGAWED